MTKIEKLKVYIKIGTFGEKLRDMIANYKKKESWKRRRDISSRRKRHSSSSLDGSAKTKNFVFIIIKNKIKNPIIIPEFSSSFFQKYPNSSWN